MEKQSLHDRNLKISHDQPFTSLIAKFIWASVFGTPKFINLLN